MIADQLSFGLEDLYAIVAAIGDGHERDPFDVGILAFEARRHDDHVRRLIELTGPRARFAEHLTQPADRVDDRNLVRLGAAREAPAVRNRRRGRQRGARLAVMRASEPVVTRARACAIAFIPVSVPSGRSTALVVAASSTWRVSTRNCVDPPKNARPGRDYSKTDARTRRLMWCQRLTEIGDGRDQGRSAAPQPRRRSRPRQRGTSSAARTGARRA